MARYCKNCGRLKHDDLCNLVELSNGKIVHASRIDRYDGDVRYSIEKGEVKVVNRWIKKRPSDA